MATPTDPRRRAAQGRRPVSLGILRTGVLTIGFAILVRLFAYSEIPSPLWPSWMIALIGLAIALSVVRALSEAWSEGIQKSLEVLEVYTLVVLLAVGWVGLVCVRQYLDVSLVLALLGMALVRLSTRMTRVEYGVICAVGVILAAILFPVFVGAGEKARMAREPQPPGLRASVRLVAR
jgi:tryptophan-rich sensory protein